MSDRFTFEEEFMKCWSVTDDIDTIADMISRTHMEPKDMDKLLNCVIGIKTLYDHRFSTTFETMVHLISIGVIK